MIASFIPKRLEQVTEDEVEIVQKDWHRGASTRIKYKTPDPKDRVVDEYYDDEQNE